MLLFQVVFVMMVMVMIMVMSTICFDNAFVEVLSLGRIFSLIFSLLTTGCIQTPGFGKLDRRRSSRNPRGRPLRVSDAGALGQRIAQPVHHSRVSSVLWWFCVNYKSYCRNMTCKSCSTTVASARWTLLGDYAINRPLLEVWYHCINFIRKDKTNTYCTTHTYSR